MILLKESFNFSSAWITLTFFTISGFLYGVIMWNLLERKYFRYNKTNAAEQDAAANP